MAEHHRLGAGSRAHLVGVKVSLRQLVELALRRCAIDFSVVDGKRTLAQQRKNIADGVSWTMHSNHLPDAAGLCGAVDIYPWVDGKTSHSTYHYKQLARAMFEAAIEHGVQIRWGGFWDEQHLDRPHWELVSHVSLEEES